MTAFVPSAEMEEAVFTDEKQVREANIRSIKEKLTAWQYITVAVVITGIILLGISEGLAG